MAPSASEKHTVGDTKTSLVNSDHLGWLLCDGRSLLIYKYQFLYSVLGNTYGGNGTSYFNLPNPAGRVPGIVGSGVGLTTRNKGDLVGEERHTLTIPEMPTHNHGVSGGNNTATSTTGVTDSGHTHGYTAPSGSQDTSSYSGAGHVTVSAGSGGATTGIGNANISDPGHNHTIYTSGGSQPHNNMQPTLFVGNMFIYSGMPNTGISPLVTPGQIY